MPELANTVDLNDSEWLQLVDDAARRNLGISGAAFMERYAAGDLGDFDDDADVMRVAALVPFSHRARP